MSLHAALPQEECSAKESLSQRERECTCEEGEEIEQGESDKDIR